jgi:pre-rRNA-processing protein TSR1
MNNDQEQTWPTTEELEKAQAQQNQLKKRVPKGTSEYQAAWILSDDEDKQSDHDDPVFTFLFLLYFIYLFILGF